MFNSDARWDRHLPHQDRDDEPIEVGAVFKKGQAVPKWFVWQGRRYAVKEVTYRWQARRGKDVLHYFSLTDGANLYQIYFNPAAVRWRLEKTAPLET